MNETTTNKTNNLVENVKPFKNRIIISTKKAGFMDLRFRLENKKNKKLFNKGSYTHTHNEESCSFLIFLLFKNPR